MNRIIIDDEILTVFRDIPSPLSQIPPGFTQINVGKERPDAGHTLPTWWIMDRNAPAIRTGGHVYKHCSR